jgi:hypothetical protein
MKFLTKFVLNILTVSVLFWEEIEAIVLNKKSTVPAYGGDGVAVFPVSQGVDTPYRAGIQNPWKQHILNFCGGIPSESGCGYAIPRRYPESLKTTHS